MTQKGRIEIYCREPKPTDHQFYYSNHKKCPWNSRFFHNGWECQNYWYQNFHGMSSYGETTKYVVIQFFEPSEDKQSSESFEVSGMKEFAVAVLAYIPGPFRFIYSSASSETIHPQLHWHLSRLKYEHNYDDQKQNIATEVRVLNLVSMLLKDRFYYDNPLRLPRLTMEPSRDWPKSSDENPMSFWENNFTYFANFYLPPSGDKIAEFLPSAKNAKYPCDNERLMEQYDVSFLVFNPDPNQ